MEFLGLFLYSKHAKEIKISELRRLKSLKTCKLTTPCRAGTASGLNLLQTKKSRKLTLKKKTTILITLLDCSLFVFLSGV